MKSSAVADPQSRVVVAQPADTLAHVRLQEEERLAHAFVPLALLLELGGDEVRSALAHVLAHLSLEVGEESRVADQEAGVEVGGERRQVVAAHAHAIREGPGGDSDSQPGVPEPVRDRLRDRLHIRVELAAVQEQEVDVGAQGQLAAAVPAHRDHGQPEVQAREVLEVPVFGQPKQLAHQPVDQVGVLLVHAPRRYA
jgi:hypothetical protein